MAKKSRTNTMKGLDDAAFSDKFHHRTKNFYNDLLCEPNREGVIYTIKQACILNGTDHILNTNTNNRVDYITAVILTGLIECVENSDIDKSTEIRNHVSPEDWIYCLVKTLDFFDHWRLDRFPTEVSDLTDILKRCLKYVSVDFVNQEITASGHLLKEFLDNEKPPRWFIVLKCGVTVEFDIV